MSGFTGNSLIVSLNSIVGNTETLGKKNWQENKIYCILVNIDSVYITRGITLRLSEKQTDGKTRFTVYRGNID